MEVIIKMKLNKYQTIALEKMQDSRAISHKLLKEFSDKEGALYSFLHIVKRHDDELNVCFRGNNNAIEIYYLNHLVWKLTPADKGNFRVSFNFNHAKLMPDRMEYLKRLEMDGKGFVLKNTGEIEWIKESFSKKDINDGLWQIFKDIMDFCFDPLKGTPQIEKRWQHKFFRDFHTYECLTKGFYVYDLEYHQKLPNKKELNKMFIGKTDDELKSMGVHSDVMKNVVVKNEPDFIGIELDTETNESYLIFGEIKSLYKSCNGKSGIMSHLEKMKEFMETDILVNKRKAEAESMLQQYSAIGDITKTTGLEGLSKRLKIKNVLVLTDSKYHDKNNTVVEWDKKGGAIKYFEDNRNDIIDKANEVRCEIWLVKNACCDDETPITMKHNICCIK